MTRMCGEKPLDYAISKLQNRNTCIEVGAYYAGWTKHLAKHFDHVISFQTPKTEKLNNVGTTDGEFSEDGLPWKENMKKRLPEKYHGRYSFDLLAEEVQDLPNVMTVLHHSPPTVPFPYTFDLMTYDISRDPTEQLRHYRWWKNLGNPGAVMLMGIYDVKPYDNFEVSTEEFYDSIEHRWEKFPLDERYTVIYL